MSDFDRQINDAFYGVGKPITDEAITFMRTFNRVADGSIYTCVTAWQDGGKIYANINKPHNGGFEDGVYTCKVGSDYESFSAWVINDFDNPPKTMRGE